MEPLSALFLPYLQMAKRFHHCFWSFFRAASYHGRRLRPNRGVRAISYFPHLKIWTLDLEEKWPLGRKKKRIFFALLLFLGGWWWNWGWCTSHQLQVQRIFLLFFVWCCCRKRDLNDFWMMHKNLFLYDAVTQSVPKFGSGFIKWWIILVHSACLSWIRYE